MTKAPGTAKGTGWLIVEDEGLVAMLIEDAIAELGLDAVGPVARVSVALELLKSHNPEGAILDVNLAGEAVYPVAAVLAERNIPFVFITGYGKSGLSSSFADRPVLQKPFMTAQIQRMVRDLRAKARPAAA
jgi:two-component SAPR family response regulator